MTTDWTTPPEDWGIMWDKHPVPSATSDMTVVCWLCQKPADLLDPDERFSIVDEVHEACRDRNSDEPDDPDWQHDDRGL